MPPAAHITIESRVDRLEQTQRAHESMHRDYYGHDSRDLGIRTKVLILWYGYSCVIALAGGIVGWICKGLAG